MPTADGAFVMAQVERVYDLLEGISLELEGRSPGGPALLRVGSREMITNYLLAPSLRAFRAKYPDTRFGVHELGAREMADALKKDWIDFAFYYHGEIPDPEIEVRRLGALRSHLYASRRLLARGRVPKTLEDALKLPFIAPRYFRADPSQPSVDGFPDQRWPRDVRFEAEFLETHRRFVLDGLAAAVLPDFSIRDERRRGLLVELPGPPLGREIYFLKRRGRPLRSAWASSSRPWSARSRSCAEEAGYSMPHYARPNRLALSMPLC
ncbi:MAG: substrate-binding domain-containing protein [Elusimicrobia bacterium]|nr:substrate-binding domain-containing protein [Elusimicrobiota bacterium]MDE2425038.1 substrate-binding domain-containing protein [Elusimicrobiota bacterium]